MKLIVNDPRVGKFEWELPATLAEQHAELGKILRKNMKLSEADASLAEKADIQHMEEMIRSFLHLLVGCVICGAPSIILTEMLKDGISDMAGTARIMLEAFKESED